MAISFPTVTISQKAYVAPPPKEVYHGVPSQENTARSLADLLRSKADNLHHMHTVMSYSISATNQALAQTTTNSILTIVMSAYAFVHANHTKVFEVQERTAYGYKIAERIVIPLTGTLVLQHLGLTNFNSRWDWAEAAEHLIALEPLQERLDKHTVISYLKSAVRHADLVCAERDINHLARQNGSAGGKIENLIRLTEHELEAHKHEDPRPIKFFRRLVAGRLPPPKPFAYSQEI